MERRPVERVRGTQDFWPSGAREVDAVRLGLEGAYQAHGYRRIEVPVLEPAELHLRKSGLEIISKLYAFDDLGGRRLCLRPELTASVVRAMIAQPAPRLPAKVFSTGPVFRYERPSRGRFRQFTQSGVELVGASGPLADAEAIGLAMNALDGLGLSDYRVTIGHVGILAELLTTLGLAGRLRGQLMEGLEAARRRGPAAMRAQLQELNPDLFEAPAGGPRVEPVDGPGDALAGVLDAARGRDAAGVRRSLTGLLSQMGAERLGRRSEADVVERLLRKLEPGDQRRAIERALEFIERIGAVRGAPDLALREGRQLLSGFGLTGEPLRSLEQTVELLGAFGANRDRVQLDLGLSRGLQYYTGMVFEIDHSGLGSESQLCGGGRYDDLFRALGARQPLPALGFAFGVERVRLALEAEGHPVPLLAYEMSYVVPAAAEVAPYAAHVAGVLRRHGKRADLDVSGRALRAALAYADREGYAEVVFVGPAEAAAGTVRQRDMATGRERTVALAELSEPGIPARVAAGAAGAASMERG